jgi:hypothetical protein
MILLVGLCADSALSQTSPQQQQTNPAEGNSTNRSTQEYRDILEHERKLIDEQSERYYQRIDRLIDRTTWAFGIVGALALAVLGWTLGKTRKELEGFAKEQLEGPVRAQFEKQVSSIIVSLNPKSIL